MTHNKSNDPRIKLDYVLTYLPANEISLYFLLVEFILTGYRNSTYGWGDKPNKCL